MWLVSGNLPAETTSRSIVLRPIYFGDNLECEIIPLPLTWTEQGLVLLSQVGPCKRLRHCITHVVDDKKIHSRNVFVWISWILPVFSCTIVILCGIVCGLTHCCL